MPRSRRIKVFIPYEMTEERAFFKKISSRFYHKEQKLWSIVNTAENIELLKTVFKGKYAFADPVKNPSIHSLHCRKDRWLHWRL